MAKVTRQESANVEIHDLERVLPLLDANEFADLLTIVREALRLEPPRYLSSIFGPPADWLPPHRRFSEYRIFDPWRFITLLRYLSDVTLPAFAELSPDWSEWLIPPVVNRRIWRPTRFYQQSDEYAGVSSFADERWFFINGVATNRDMAQFNSAYLAHLFHRPLTVIQNATDSLPLDLWECAIGKGVRTHPDIADRKTMTEPAWRATPAILEALNADEIERVVVIAHSQGTIIMANVLRAAYGALERQCSQGAGECHAFAESLMGRLETETHRILCHNLAHALREFVGDDHEQALTRLKKLEIYTFANCADKMCYVDAAVLGADTGRPVPYMEHFANERDIVARLGILSPFQNGPEELISIDGPVFEREDAWGHLLNEHYLAAIDEYKNRHEDSSGSCPNPYPCVGEPARTPRLYEYCFGGKPAAQQRGVTRQATPPS